MGPLKSPITLAKSIGEVGTDYSAAIRMAGSDSRAPKVRRQAGRFMREVQNTSHAFVAEMERAADSPEPSPARDLDPAVTQQKEP